MSVPGNNSKKYPTLALEPRALPDESFLATDLAPSESEAVEFKLKFQSKRYEEAVAEVKKNARQLKKAQQDCDAFDALDAVFYNKEFQALEGEIKRLKKNQELLEAKLLDKQEELYQAYKVYIAFQSETVDDDSVDIPTLMDNVMRAAFIVGFGLSLALLFATGSDQLVEANVRFGYTWNLGIDAPAGALGTAFGGEKSSLHNQAWDGAQYFSAAQLAGGTGLNLINTLSGFGPLAFGALGSITFAACMWITTGQMAHKAYRAYRKSTDTDYFIEEREKAIKREEELLKDRRTPLDRLLGRDLILPTSEQVYKSKKKIEVKDKQLKALQCYRDEENRKKEQGKEYAEPTDKETRQKLAIAQFLQEKENEKFKKYGKEFFVWLGASGVMTTIAVVTTIAVLAAAAVVCPPAVIAVGAFVALLKGAQIVHSIVDKDYSKEALKAQPREGKSEAEHKDDLLTQSIRQTLTAKTTGEEYLDADINAIKEALSDKDKEKMIAAQAREGYNVNTYLGTKATNTKKAVSEASNYLGTKASNAKTAISGAGNRFYSFFSRTQEKGQEAVTLERHGDADLYALGKIPTPA